jgi:hypothetical protein
MILFRPTGLRELQLVLQRDLAGWPPRLPDQPIFYPVTTARYAAQIAREWNTKSELRAGYVTEFAVDDAYVSQFERKIVGSREHEELWVPAEQLEELNHHITAPIRVIDAYFGEEFVGLVPDAGALQGKHAREQLAALAGLLVTGDDLRAEITLNREAVFLHLPYWRQLGGAPANVLTSVERAWSAAFPRLSLAICGGA